MGLVFQGLGFHGGCIAILSCYLAALVDLSQFFLFLPPILQLSSYSQPLLCAAQVKPSCERVKSSPLRTGQLCDCGCERVRLEEKFEKNPREVGVKEIQASLCLREERGRI